MMEMAFSQTIKFHRHTQRRGGVEANIGVVTTPYCISGKEHRTGDSVEKKAEGRLLKSSFRIRRACLA